MGKPLITFALFAYNQERYIREAVGGALTQTYSPLQIILSDDCSTDRTFDIMKEVTSAYNGPHHIVLNHNERNVGIPAHVNRIMELAKGELIVGAAGDDISLPHRTERIYKAWKRSGRRATSIYSDFSLISKTGDFIKSKSAVRPSDINLTNIISEGKCPRGCSNAWSPILFRKFGPLKSDFDWEDQVLSFRSALIGSFVRIKEELVLCRVLPGSAGSPFLLCKPNKLRSVIIKQLEKRYNICLSFIDDLEKVHYADNTIRHLIFQEMNTAKVLLDAYHKHTTLKQKCFLCFNEYSITRDVKWLKHFIKCTLFPLYAHYLYYCVSMLCNRPQKLDHVLSSPGQKRMSVMTPINQDQKLR